MKKRSFFLVGGVFFLASFFALPLFLRADEPLKSVWDIRELPMGDVTVTAHGGAGHLGPENVFSSLKLTWGLPYCDCVPECDIRTTKDNVLVMFHDSDFSRTFPDASEEMKSKGVEDLTWEEARQLDIGGTWGEEFKGQPIVSLAEIRDALREDPNRKVCLDVKNVDFEQLAKETEGLHHQVILATGIYDELAPWKEVAPESDTLFWMGGGAGEDVVGPVIEHLKEDHFANVDRIQIHVHFDENGKTRPSEEFLLETANYIHTYYPSVELQFMPWDLSTEDKKENYWKLIELGASGFGTDRPDICVEAINDYYSGKNQ